MTEITHPALVAALVKPGPDIVAQMTPDKADLWHAATGVAGEAGELLDAIKKVAIYNKPLDVDNVIEELGDLEFYMEQLRQRLSKLLGRTVTREECLQANIEKLSQRYESLTYSDKAAQERADKVNETPRKFFGQQGQQEHSEVLRAAGVPSEGDGGEHGAIMDAIRGG